MTLPSTDRVRAVLDDLAQRGLDEAEVYGKTGRSRRLERARGTETSSFHQEQGWAVRASTGRGSFLSVGTGELPDKGGWPHPDGHPMRLPTREQLGGGAPAPPFKPPADLDAPLVGEREGLGLLDSIARELEREMTGARLVHALLEDGSSESVVRNHSGLAGSTRQRLALLRLEARGPAPPAATGRAAPRALLVSAEREPRRLHPPALARRLADLLLARLGEPAERRDRGELLLAPAVGTAILQGILPLLVGARAAERGARYRDARSRLTSDGVTIVDDGRLAGGLLEAGVDGEGVPTRRVVLVDDGVFRRPLLAWHETRAGGPRPSGVGRRASFRDAPAPGPTHLYVEPAPKVGVAQLLGSVARGYYFLDVDGPGHFDLDEDRFTLPVVGYSVRQGRADAPVAEVSLTGTLSGLLRGIQGVGRDLAFLPRDGMLGCPTLLVTGPEVVSFEAGPRPATR
jgi:predicted Zn-dependent protease